MLVVDVFSIVWAGHVLTCPECGATQRWRLTSDDGAAWATCSAGHQRAHPLVYPEVVGLAAEWAPATSTPEAHGPWRRALGGVNWRPHWLDAAGVYQGWESGPSPEFWRERWPALVAAQKHLDDVREWQRGTRDSDLSFMWMSYWGTTEPDRTAIEFVDFARPEPMVEPPRA